MAVRPNEEHPCELNRKWNYVCRLYIGLSEVFALLSLTIFPLSSPSAHSEMRAMPPSDPLKMKQLYIGLSKVLNIGQSEVCALALHYYFSSEFAFGSLRVVLPTPPPPQKK